jgi:hypothetical protein
LGLLAERDRRERGKIRDRERVRDVGRNEGWRERGNIARMMSDQFSRVLMK